MNQCLVSILLPSLNVAQYMEECLLSACNQTLRDIEIICVDAGSTDGTLQIIKKYQSADSRIRVFQSEKRSYGYQVNLGLDVARGEYVAILETDDYVDTDMYESLYKLAKETNCDFVKGNYRRYFTYQNGERVFIPSDTLTYAREKYESILDVTTHLELIQYDTNVWSGIYRKDFIEKNHIRCNESPGAAFQDIGFLQQIFWNAKTGYYTKRCYYNYCIDRELSSSNNGNNLKYAFQEYQVLLSDYSKGSDIQNWNIVYERMADVFEENIRKTLLQGMEADNMEMIEWFAEILVQKNKGGAISRAYLGEISSGLKEWLDQIKESINVQEKHIDSLFRAIKRFPVVIFGAGVRGKTLLQQMEKYCIDVCAYCDNNSTLWGENIAGIEICSMDRTIALYPNAKYIIANKKNYLDIKRQLLSGGVSEDSIAIWGE